MSEKSKKPDTLDAEGLSANVKVQNIELNARDLNKNIANNDDGVPEINLEHSQSFLLHTKDGVFSLKSSELNKIRIAIKKSPNKNLIVLPKKKNVTIPFENIIRVGINYFLIDKENNYVRTNKQNIEDDYGKGSSKDVEIFLGFKNMPNHINYKESMNGYKNLYKRLTHKPKKGNWETIKKMLKHIFKDKDYEMILTYCWVLYNSPTHALPFLGIVGELKNTGKTTLLEFFKMLFEQNAKIIDSEDISANFNSGYIDSIVILIDESLQGKDKSKDLQKFKKLITGGTQTRKAKFQDDTDINFYGKFIMASNNIDTVISIEKENTRFWIVKVGELHEDILDFKDGLKKEIPAFLHFLQYEYKPIEKKSRLWLNPKDFQSEVVKTLQRNSRSSIIKELIERMTDYFVENENAKEIKFTGRQFLDMCEKAEWGSKYFSTEIKSSLDKVSKREYSNNPFYSQTKYITVKDQGFNEPIQQRFYTFTREEVHKLNPEAELI